MPTSQPLISALAAAGYQLLDSPNSIWGTTRAVVDATGQRWLCTVAEVCSSQDWAAAQETAAELSSGRHRHVVGLHDVVVLGEEHGERSNHDEPGVVARPFSRVLIWAAGTHAQRLGEYRSQQQLDLEQISAVLVAAGRGLASLESLGLHAPADWTLDDLVLQDDGTLQICPDGITARRTNNASEQLRRVARNGQVLLDDVDGDQRSPDLAHLLTATAFDESPVGSGTFAALCHELVTPAGAGSWRLSPRARLESGSCLEPEDGGDGGAAGTSAATSRTDAARYSDLTHNWRNYVRTGTRSGQSESRVRRFGAIFPARVFAGRTSRPGRHKADRTPGQYWHKRRRGLATIGAGILVAGLGTQMVFGGSSSEQITEATDRGTAITGDEAPVVMVEPVPVEQQQGQIPRIPEESVVPDPDAAAMELTEERLRILQDLRAAPPEKSAQSASDILEERLATVLVPKSPAMTADLSLASALANSPSGTENVFAEARTARTLSQGDETAVVEVSYDLVDPDAEPDSGTVAQSATLTLTLVDDSWLVNAVSDAPPTEPQL